MNSMSDQYNKRTMKGHFQAIKLIFQRLQMFFRVLNKVLFKRWKLGSAQSLRNIYQEWK